MKIVSENQFSWKTYCYTIAPREEVIGSLLTYAGCGPGYCFCKDAPEKEIDVRNQLFYDVLDLCEKNEIDRCLCEDGKSKINGPIDLVGLFSCRPKKCKCKGSKEVKVNTGTGCAKGGFPDCPTPGELYCKDGLKLDPSATMRFRTKTAVERRQFGKGWKGCACSDGVMPRCKETGEPLKCPSGDFPDYDKYHGMEELAACRIEQW